MQPIVLNELSDNFPYDAKLFKCEDSKNSFLFKLQSFLLNAYQACAGLWLVCVWFLKIISVRMSVCVCMPPRLLIISN